MTQCKDCQYIEILNEEEGYCHFWLPTPLIKHSTAIFPKVKLNMFCGQGKDNKLLEG